MPRQRAVRRLAPGGEVRRDLTEGPGELANGASFGLAALRDADGSAVRAAWRADTRACREHTDASASFVVHPEEGPASARNADVILFSRAERIDFDRGDTEPAYARHTIVARTGQVVTTVGYTFLTGSAVDAGNFARARKLLERQLRQGGHPLSYVARPRRPGLPPAPAGAVGVPGAVPQAKTLETEPNADIASLPA